MQLTETPEIVEWPETHYVFLEKTGPFMNTAPQAWQQVHKSIPVLSESSKVTGYMSLYQIGPKIYRAGVAVADAPASLPEGLAYERFAGGKYARFTLTGPYMHLPEASGRVWQLFAASKLEPRDGFAIENYVNDPRTTPEAELVTQILIPCA